MSMEPFGWDIFIRHTNTDGKSYVQQHRTWSAERLLASLRQAVDKLNADAKKKEPPEPALAKAEQITADQYHKEK